MPLSHRMMVMIWRTNKANKTVEHGANVCVSNFNFIKSISLDAVACNFENKIMLKGPF